MCLHVFMLNFKYAKCWTVLHCCNCILCILWSSIAFIHLFRRMHLSSALDSVQLVIFVNCEANWNWNRNRSKNKNNNRALCEMSHYFQFTELKSRHRILFRCYTFMHTSCETNECMYDWIWIKVLMYEQTKERMNEWTECSEITNHSICIVFSLTHSNHLKSDN